MWNASCSSRMPGASSLRSITAAISLRPTPAFWPSGSTVIGPTPRIGSRSSRKLDPTIRPSISATTPQIEGCGSHIASIPVAASSAGKSRGNRWWSWRPPKASKRICAQRSASPGSASRNVTCPAASADTESVMVLLYIGGLVLVVAADPHVGRVALVASLRSPIEQPVEAHHELEAARSGRVRVVDDAVGEREGAQHWRLRQVSGGVCPACDRQLWNGTEVASFQERLQLLL